MTYIKVVNFEKYQHYDPKKRRPPWIKLYNSLLDDYEFGCLQDASKMLAIGLWLLASRCNNKIPCDPKWISEQLHLTEKVDLECLVSAGFITISGDASNMLATCKQNATLEVEVEVEVEEEVEKKPPTRKRADPTPLFVEYWNKTASDAGLPTCRNLSAKRRKALTIRNRDPDWAEGWREALDKIPGSDFLCGRVDGRGWQANVDWFLKPDSVTSILEGKYDNKGTRGTPIRPPTDSELMASLKAKVRDNDQAHLTFGDIAERVGTKDELAAWRRHRAAQRARDDDDQRRRATQAARREPSEGTAVSDIVAGVLASVSAGGDT